MVETSWSRCPFDNLEILAIVFGVAAGALLAGVRFQTIGGVQTPPCSQARGDLGVALEALQSACGPQLVTGRTVRRAVQSLMGAREWAGRYLRVHLSC